MFGLASFDPNLELIFIVQFEKKKRIQFRKNAKQNSRHLLSPVTHLFNRKTNVFHKQTLFPRCKQKMHQDFSRAFILFNYGPPTKIKKLKNAINCKPNKIMIIVCLSKQKYLICFKIDHTHKSMKRFRNKQNCINKARTPKNESGKRNKMSDLTDTLQIEIENNKLSKNNSTFVSYFFNL